MRRKSYKINIKIVQIAIIYCIICIQCSCYREAYSEIINEGGNGKDKIEVVISCRLGKYGEHTLKILRKKQSNGWCVYYKQYDAGEYVYYREINGNNKDIEIDEREMYSALEHASISCQGIDEKIFVMTSPPFNGRGLSSLFIRYNSDVHEWEEFVMGSPSHPLYIYINKNELIGITENDPLDRGKPDQIYRIQGYVAEKGIKFKYSMPITKLPPKKGYQVIRLVPQILLNDADEPEYLDKNINCK